VALASLRAAAYAARMGGAIDPDFSELLARLYGGIGGDQPWRGFLEALARWMDATFATIIITTGDKRHPATFVTPGGSEEFNAAYASTLFADDPFRGLPDGKVTSYAEFMANLPDSASPQYRATMRDTGFDLVLGVDLRFPGRFEARFRVSRHNSLPDFTRAERLRLQALVPHLRIALELFERLQFAGAEHGVFHSAAQGLGLAVVVLDRGMRIVSSNPLADHVLGAGEGLVRRGDQLAFAAPDHQRTVAALLAGNAAPAAEPPPLTRFRVPRPVHGDIVVTARPLDVRAIHAGTGAIALFLARPGPEAPTDPQSLRDLLGLTPAEARLAAALAEGSTLVDAARRLGIAHNTAKVQLRSVFAKTGVNRQAQLVALLASLGG
jgi:DNA-binding CsgD family transcriptional regulator/PAS domain-containing protein